MRKQVAYLSAFFYRPGKDPITMDDRNFEHAVFRGQFLNSEDGEDTPQEWFNVPEQEFRRLEVAHPGIWADEAMQTEAAATTEAFVDGDERVVMVGDTTPLKFSELQPWQLVEVMRQNDFTPSQVLDIIEQETDPAAREQLARNFMSAENDLAAGDPREELAHGVAALLGSAPTGPSGSEGIEGTAPESDEDTGGGSAGGEQGQSSSSPEATDAAVAYAKDQNVDLADVKGTGSGGRITKDDVEAYVKAHD